MLRCGGIVAALIWSQAALAADGAIDGSLLCDRASEGMPEWSASADQPGIDVIIGGRYKSALSDAMITPLVNARVKDILTERSISEKTKSAAGSTKGKVVNTDDAYLRQQLVNQLTEYLDERRDRSFCFFALRIDAKNFDLSMLNLVQEISPNRPSGATRSFKDVVVDYHLEALDKALRFSMGQPLLLTNAGWSIGVTDLRPVGLTRIDGKTLIEEAYVSGGLSAILCLSQRADEDAQPLSLYYFDNGDKFGWNPDREAQLSACDDYVQVGPRIVEWHNAQAGAQPNCLDRLKKIYGELAHKVGVCDTTLFSTPRRRTVLIANYGGGDLAIGMPDEPKLYLLVTQDEVVHFDIQDLVLKSGLFGPPESVWAVNLAGDKLTSMIYQPSETGRSLKRDERVSLFTALALFPRRTPR